MDALALLVEELGYDLEQVEERNNVLRAGDISRRYEMMQ